MLDHNKRAVILKWTKRSIDLCIALSIILFFFTAYYHFFGNENLSDMLITSTIQLLIYVLISYDINKLYLREELAVLLEYFGHDDMYIKVEPTHKGWSASFSKEHSRFQKLFPEVMGKECYFHNQLTARIKLITFLELKGFHNPDTYIKFEDYKNFRND